AHVTAWIAAPPDLPLAANWIYSGYIAAEPGTPGLSAVSTAYVGMKGAMRSMSILPPAGSDLQRLTYNGGGSSSSGISSGSSSGSNSSGGSNGSNGINGNSSGNVSSNNTTTNIGTTNTTANTGNNDTAVQHADSIVVRFRNANDSVTLSSVIWQPTPLLVIDVLDVVHGRNLGVASGGRFDYVGRNFLDSNERTDFVWTGEVSRFRTAADAERGRPVPAGTYQLRLKALKVFGSRRSESDWELWHSPNVTVVR
ncbi:hypothetical protein GQ42DRAFT_15441, partial [Ramicandelaber brevisporus]